MRKQKNGPAERQDRFRGLRPSLLSATLSIVLIWIHLVDRHTSRQ